MQAMILKAQFIDRAGRTVYSMNEIQLRPNPENPDETQMTEGPAVGLVRMKPLESEEAAIEWFTEPEKVMAGPPRAEVPQVGPDGFAPGVEFEGPGGVKGGGTG